MDAEGTEIITAIRDRMLRERDLVGAERNRIWSLFNSSQIYR